MLEDIVAQLLARSRKGLQTRSLKVKAHIGNRGNTEADKLATAAIFMHLVTCLQQLHGIWQASVALVGAPYTERHTMQHQALCSWQRLC